MTRLLLLCALLTSLACHAHPDIQRLETKAGVPVLFVAAPEIPMFIARVVFAAGSAQDGERPGLATLTGALMGEGTVRLGTDDLHARLEATGARLNTGVERDLAWFSLKSLTRREYAEPALALASEALAQPRFDTADFKLMQARMQASLKQQESAPAALAALAMESLLYPGHPYGQPAGGTEVSLAALRREHVQDFHRRFYVAANALVVLVGDLSQTEALRIAESLVGKLPPGTRAPKIPEVPARSEPLVHHIPFQSAQTHLSLAQPGISRHDPDYFPLVVGNHVLGATAVSLLFQEIREKRGLSYSVSSHFSPMAVAGPFEISLQTDQANTAKVRKILRETVARYIAEGPDEAALVAARDNLIGGFPLRIDTNRKLTDYLTMIGFHDLPLDWLDRYPEAVAKVSAQEVRDAFQRRIRLDTMVEVLVGPVAQEP